jgi:hypothetical protein
LEHSSGIPDFSVYDLFCRFDTEIPVIGKLVLTDSACRVHIFIRRKASEPAPLRIQKEHGNTVFKECLQYCRAEIRSAYYNDPFNVKERYPGSCKVIRNAAFASLDKLQVALL